jgi:transposase
MVMVAAVIADRAYDSDAILEWIALQGAVAVIPPHPSRAGTRKTDWHLYKERAKIECLFGKMKHFRRVFSRFDKLARRYLAFVHFVAACVLLR